MKTKKTQSTAKFPSEKVLGEMRRKHSRGIASRPLRENATEVEKLKHSLCREFVIYSNSPKLTNREMAKFFDRVHVTIKVAGW